MRVLVIFAHPVETSYAAALHRTVQESLAGRHEVRGRGLYRVKIGVGDLPKAHITRYFRWFCAKEAKVRYLAHYHMNVSTPKSRTAYQARVARELAAL